MIKKIICATGIGILCAASTQASISFTTAEGYSDGALNSNDDWSAKQWTVDETAGTVTENGYTSAIYTGTVGTRTEGTTFTVSTTFTFTDGFDISATGYKPLFNTGFTSNADAYSVENQLLLAFDRNNDGYTADLQGDWGSSTEDNIAGTSGDNNSGVFTAASVGITRGATEEESDLVSDHIMLTFSLTAGETASDWTAVSTIYNVDTETEVASFTTGGLTFDAETFYASFGTGQSDSNANTSDRTVYDFEVIPEPATIGLLGLGACALIAIRRKLR